MSVALNIRRRTERLAPARSDEDMHVAGWAYAEEIDGDSVRYHYGDETEIGLFTGDDTTSAAEFERMYPVVVGGLDVPLPWPLDAAP